MPINYSKTGLRTATLTIAANNALDTGRADYVCDGTADDVQIQAAIDALPAVGGTVLLSEGQYNIAASLTITGRVDLIGQGRDNTNIKLAASANVDMIKNGSDPFATIQGVSIQRMTLDGNKANNTSGKGLNGNGFSNLLLFHVTIQNTQEEGLYGAIQSGITPSTWKIYDTHVAASGEAGAVKDNVYFQGTAFWAYGLYSLTATQHGIHFVGGNELFLIGWASDQNGGHGLVLSSVGQSEISGGYTGANTLNGIYLSGTSHNNRIHDNVSYMNTLAGIYIDTTQTESSIHHNQFIDNTGWGYRAPGATFARVLIDHNVAQNNTAGNWSTTELGTGATYGDNDVLLGPGETRVASGALTAGLVNTYAFNWQNPHASKVLIKRVLIYISTAGGTATAVLDVGKATATATHDDTLIDGLDLNTTGVFDNLNDAGTNGKSRQIVDENGGTNDWVTGQILVEAASSLVGRYEIEYVGI